MFQEGSQIGYYTLIKKLGRGGFGEVWLAENEGKQFAFKLPHKDQIDWKLITQEIGLWTLCGNHSNVMPLVGARNFNGQIAIISEYAPDGSLEDLLKAKGELPVDEVVEMTIGILEGLQHLHESGIIHRDLKPANILLDGKTPRLTDFGISRIISADGLSETIAGTFAYMAPECFDGKRNVQTDIWSVGVILYRMLTGCLPFPQKDQTELMSAIIMRDFEPLPNHIPQNLQNVIVKLLAKLPENRYTSSAEARENLHNIFQDLVSYQSVFVHKLDENIPTVSIAPYKNILIPYRKGDKWGFCDAEKNIVIEPKYNSVERFSEGLANVRLDNKEGFINTSGEETIPLKYSVAESFKEGLAAVTLIDRRGNFKWGFIDKSGAQIIPFRYDSISIFSEGLIAVRRYDKLCFIDSKGEEVVPFHYHYPSVPYQQDDPVFSEGLARVQLIGEHGYCKYGFIDKTGKEVVPLQFEKVDDFKDGLAAAVLDKKLYFINKKGQKVISLNCGWGCSFREGLAAVMLKNKWGNSKWGFIDRNGTVVIPAKYDMVGHFSEGLALVGFHGTSGFIDKTGKEVIDLKYDYDDDDMYISYLHEFKEGIALVNKGKKWSYIGRDGTEYFED